MKEKEEGKCQVAERERERERERYGSTSKP